MWSRNGESAAILCIFWWWFLCIVNIHRDMESTGLYCSRREGSSCFSNRFPRNEDRVCYQQATMWSCEHILSGFIPAKSLVISMSLKWRCNLHSAFLYVTCDYETHICQVKLCWRPWNCSHVLNISPLRPSFIHTLPALISVHNHIILMGGKFFFLLFCDIL